MILTIDIGIRNLAMCIMSCIDAKLMNTYKIELWEVYNTLDSDDYHCMSLMKNGKICNKKCSSQYNNSDNKIFCCKAHFPKTISYEKTNIFKKKIINDYLLQDIAKVILSKIQEIYDNNIIIFNQLTQILIELQPKINQKMKFISHILYGKFVELFKDNNVTIKFVRASQKLKAYIGPEIICDLKNAYAKRKYLSIQYTKWFLENKFNQEQKEIWLSLLLKTSKPDDKTDTFLMNLNAHYGIPNKKKLKI